MEKEQMTVDEFLELLKKIAYPEETKIKKDKLDMIHKGDKLKVKIKCNECNKDFYKEFELKGSCSDCHKKFEDKVQNKIKEWRKQGKPETPYEILTAMYEVIKEEIKSDKS